VHRVVLRRCKEIDDNTRRQAERPREFDHTIERWKVASTEDSAYIATEGALRCAVRAAARVKEQCVQRAKSMRTTCPHTVVRTFFEARLRRRDGVRRVVLHGPQDGAESQVSKRAFLKLLKAQSIALLLICCALDTTQSFMTNVHATVRVHSC
jgi:hypothetical protein